jgi:Cu-Zn family superoxide dismutase
VDVLGAANKKLGTATLTEGKQGVLIRLTLTAGTLTPGWHGLHIHEKGDCSAAGFTSAGAHVGHSASVMHGLLNPRGPEPGDLPSLYAPAAGPISAEVFSPWSTLAATADGQRQPLLDADGSALVIHANVDDQQSQPIGGAGDRVGCAVIK